MAAKTKTSFAEGQLKALIERIERLEEEKKAIAADIREVYAEAKGTGFDEKIMRKVISLRKKEASERAEEEALLDVYLAALGMTIADAMDDDEDESDNSQNAERVEPKPTQIQETPVSSNTPSGVNPAQAGGESLGKQDEAGEGVHAEVLASPAQIPADAHRQDADEAEPSQTLPASSAPNSSQQPDSTHTAGETAGNSIRPNTDVPAVPITPEPDLAEAMPGFLKRERPATDFLRAG